MERAAVRYPAFAWLKERWEPSGEAVTGIPKAARRPATIEAYLPGSIAELALSLPDEVVTAVIDAETAVARAQQYAEHVGVATVATQLLRSEAIASSRMEGVEVPSHRSLAKAIAGNQHRPTAQAAIANIEAIKLVYAQAASDQPLTQDALLDTHLTLSRADRYLAAHGGKLRQRQNWIGIDANTPVGAEFVPPPGRFVEPLLGDVFEYAARDDMPAVVQAAVLHAQFETIHPFGDGNGRVGRALIGQTLIRRGVAESVIPPVSLVLSRDRDAYVQGLTGWRFSGTDGATTWIRTLAGAIEAAAIASEELAHQVSDLVEHWMDQAGQPRRNSAPRRIIYALPGSPIIGSAAAQEITGANESATLRALNRLEEAGVLTRTTVGKRNRQWECVGLFALLDEMERQLSAGQRGAAVTS